MFSVLVKRVSPVFYTVTKEVVSPPEIWALQFSLDNKYIVAAGGVGEVDVIEISLSLWNCVDLMKSFLDMGSWSKTIMCQLQT